MDPLRKLPAAAREAIRAHLEGREPAPTADPISPSAPVFVTLRLADDLRGCMGELEARFDDLVDETMDRAVVAAIHDPRFPALTLEELPATTIEVTILGPLEPATEQDLDPEVFGIEIEDEAGRRAVLLPAIEGVDTVERQIGIARRKANIAADAPIRIRRFRVTKVTE